LRHPQNYLAGAVTDSGEFQIYSFNGQIGHTSCRGGENLMIEVELSVRPSNHPQFNSLVASVKETSSRGELHGDECVITTLPPIVTQSVLEFRDGSFRVSDGES
jgi:hypothetical protein